MLLTAHKNLKAAITGLPEKEKDKLLLRLIAKDKVLTEHLHFKLLEGESDLADRQSDLRDEIDSAIDLLNMNKKANAKDTIILMRSLNGRINHHYKVTKDLYSEIELRFHLLTDLPLNLKISGFSATNAYNEKLITYFVRTTLSVYKKYLKLHEDLQFDLVGQLNQILAKVHQGRTKETAAALGLPEEI